jgi:hypothetical protein
MKFNKGKLYHGSDAITQGKLTGTTDNTDYFYFFCPQCDDRHIMRILDHTYRDGPVAVAAYPNVRPRQVEDFVLVFKLYCPACKMTDFVKMGNTGWQEGRLPD